MMVRTIFDPSTARIQDMHATVKRILQFDSEKVRIHPSDGRRVIHALRYFIQDIDKDKLSKL